MSSPLAATSMDVDPSATQELAIINADPSADTTMIAAPSSSQESATLSCNVCNKNFTQKCHLTRHLKTHSDKKDFSCGICKKEFTQNTNLKRHMKTHKKAEVSPTFECSDCGKSFGRKDNMERHLLSHFRQFPCLRCDSNFNRREHLQHHVKVTHPKQRIQTSAGSTSKKRKMDGALGVFKTQYIFPNDNAVGDLLIFLEKAHTQLKDMLIKDVETKRAMKWYCVSKIMFSRTNVDGEVEIQPSFFSSKMETELDTSQIELHINQAFEKIKSSFDAYIERGSGWVLDKIIHLEVKTATYHPLAPSSYIVLPKKLADKKAVLNIQNEDEKCFVWCVLAALHPVNREDQPHRVAHYQDKEEEVKMGNVTCPVLPSKVQIIERLNNLRINIFGYEDDEVCPIYISKREDEQVINLLYISEEDNHHYCLIRDMSRLLGDLTNHDGRRFYCYSCLHRFAKEETLKKHIPYCNEHTPQHIVMPLEKDRILQFSQHRSTQKVPYIIYADFEALVEKLDDTTPAATVNTATHTPCGYAYIIIGPDGNPMKPISNYRGPNAVDHFITNIIAEKNELAVKLITNVPMKITQEDFKIIRQATDCGICKDPLGDDRVRDHDHITGKFRQVVHNQCNLNFRLRKMIPCVFHNLKNYDAHLIMQGLGKLQDHDISVIPNTMEKYISFSLTKKLGNIPITLQFIDSLQFLNASLQKLVDNLEKDKFSILKSCIQSPHIDLLLKKGVYPYEYMSSFDTFEETSLPPQSAFFSTLTNSSISDKEYQHAQTVWDCFNITNLGEYHDLYVKTDVLLLAGVFENFRQLTLNYYKLDGAHMMTSPGLAWQAALKMTDVKLDLFTDLDMHLFIEKGIRGGVSMITHRHSSANHPDCPDYNLNEENRHILYLDANNLYGWAMSEPLPVGDFRWEDPEAIQLDDIINQADNADEGYILEVDLDYPDELHDLHNSYPLAPERFTIRPDMLSTTAKGILEKMGMKPAPSSEKLVPNLQSKTNYVLHYRNLKLYLKLGLKLVKIHRILKFSQQAWLKKYIHFNTEQRTKSTTSFEKDFFKLLNNAVFGKTMENLRNRVDVQLVNTTKKAKKLVASPAFCAFTEFDNNLVAVQRKVKTLTLNRPIHVGFAILELSKVLMYEFHYEVMMNKYDPKNIRLLFTDTDSLTYEITTPNLTSDLHEMRDYFDFSDYPADHPLHSTDNKKQIGKFKDELNGKHGFEFIGLRSKMYSILSECGVKQTAKGISRSAARQQLKHQNYRDTLLNNQTSSVVQHRIGSTKHQIFSIQQTKRALSAFDDKRYLLEDGITSYAYGHYKISEM